MLIGIYPGAHIFTLIMTMVEFIHKKSIHAVQTYWFFFVSTSVSAPMGALYTLSLILNPPPPNSSDLLAVALSIIPGRVVCTMSILYHSVLCLT